MGTKISLDKRTIMPITLIQLTPFRLALDLARLSPQRTAQDGTTSNIPADILPVAGTDQIAGYSWEGCELDIPVLNGSITSNNAPPLYVGQGLQTSLSSGSPAWTESASWGCSAVRGSFLQPATWVA